MGLMMVLESVTSASFVGLGCGTGCGTGVSAALYGYLMAHVRDAKESLRGFGEFLLGKILAVAALCALASYLGQGVMGEGGLLVSFPLKALVDLGLVLWGVYLLVQEIRRGMERRRETGIETGIETGRKTEGETGRKIEGEKHCKGCDHCSSKFPREGSLSHLALLGMGVGYGLTPCAPLIMMTGQAATLPFTGALILGTVFALASVLSPGLLFLVLSGFLAKGMRREIPSYLSLLRIISYLLMIAVFFHSFLRA